MPDVKPKTATSPPTVPDLPDFTKAQGAAIAQFFVAIVVLLGFNVDGDMQKVIGAISTALAVALPAADVALHRKRLEHFADIHAARVQASADPAATLQQATTLLAQVSTQVDALAAKLEAAPPAEEGAPRPRRKGG